MGAMKHGYFITFEGGEGAGKSLQVEILTSHLVEEGYEVVTTREPGGTRIGEQIRGITHNIDNVDLHPIAEAYLMAAARAQHVTQIIKPALDVGKIVVCDRFVDSSIAYQGYGRKLGPETIASLNELAVDGAKPHLTLYLDIPPGVGHKRRLKASSKAQDRLDLQQMEFYDRVCEGYEIVAKNNKERYVRIDANRTIEIVAGDIWHIVKTKLSQFHGKTS